MSSGEDLGRLWAPWRMSYILGDKEADCIFCKRAEDPKDEENLILFRGKTHFIIMNKYPYNNGHLMVVPYRHTADFESLSSAESSEMIGMISKSISVLRKTMSPDGFNVGMNLGRIAGAGIDDHLHFHVVPRWAADTNFMPIIGETKVISEALSETWRKLKRAFESDKGNPQV